MQPDIRQLDPDRDLRAELAAAIDAAHAADAAFERANGIAIVADNLMRDAGAEVARLQEEQRETQRLTTGRRAECIMLAIRSGSDLPHPPLPSPADTTALAQAMGNLNALELAADKLNAERDAARAVAADAAQAAQRLVNDILVGEAHSLAADLVTSTERTWMLFDRLAGLVRADESRHDGPKLRELQAHVIQRIDRNKAAIARNSLYIERHNYNEHIDGLAVAEERLWRDYATRLMTDANASFDP